MYKILCIIYMKVLLDNRNLDFEALWGTYKVF